MKKLTIFTPTYNREHILPKLFKSLQAQSCKDFIWLIVDDGSSDQTVELIKKWQLQGILDIVLYKQENQGKHVALRNAIAKCGTPWFICVDSDDFLSANAVYWMLQDVKEMKNSTSIGVIYPQKMRKTENVLFPSEDYLINIMDAKNRFGIAETAILFKTEIFQKIDVPQYEGEKFLSEEILYIQLAQYGKFVTKNKSFYISEYRSDGLTNNLFRLWKNNPKGTIRLMNDRYVFSNGYSTKQRILQKVKAIMNLNALCMVDHFSILTYSPNKKLSLILILPSLVWMKIRFYD